MTWVRLDDAFLDHPKVATLSDRALRLYLYALSWCHRFQNGGVFRKQNADWMVARVRGKRCHLQELLEVGPGYEHGLLEECDGGYRIHDFEDYCRKEPQNPADDARSQKAEAGRLGGLKSAAARKARREAGQANGQAPGKQNPSTEQANGQAESKQNPSPVPDPEVASSEAKAARVQANSKQEASKHQQALSVQEQATRYVRDPMGARNELGPPESWPPLVELRKRAAQHIPAMAEVPRGGWRSGSVRAPIERLAEGYAVDDLVRAVEGLAADEWVKSRPKLQHLAWLCETPDRVDKFAAAAREATSPSHEELSAGARAARVGEAKARVRAALAAGKAPSPEWASLLSDDDMRRIRRTVARLREATA